MIGKDFLSQMDRYRCLFGDDAEERVTQSSVVSSKENTLEHKDTQSDY